MSNRFLDITISNESDASLECSSQTLVSGQFSTELIPPDIIPARKSGNFRIEQCKAFGFLPVSGIRGSVEYRIQDQNEPGWLRMVWNRPVWSWWNRGGVEVEVSPDWDAAIISEPEISDQIVIRLRPTVRQSVPDFDVAKNTFAFTNSWSRDLPVISPGFLWNRFIDCLPGFLQFFRLRPVTETILPFTRAHQGLCGGMVFSVIDFHRAGVSIPSVEESPQNLTDPLYLFIKNRLWKSFDIPWGGMRYLIYSLPFYPNGSARWIKNFLGLIKGRVWVSFREEWPKIRADIDSGNLSPIGLVQTATFRISEDHQVLAYAYEQSGNEVVLFLYDPNEGPTEVTFRFRISLHAPWVEVTRTPPNRNRIWCFFRTNHYKPAHPPVSRPVIKGNQ